ncbi:TPA: hypothetical protein ACGOYE_000940 [Streptococcus suis]
MIFVFCLFDGAQSALSLRSIVFFKTLNLVGTKVPNQVTQGSNQPC